MAWTPKPSCLSWAIAEVAGTAVAAIARPRSRSGRNGTPGPYKLKRPPVRAAVLRSCVWCGSADARDERAGDRALVRARGGRGRHRDLQRAGLGGDVPGAQGGEVRGGDDVV